jgi:hypothetical protein
VKVRREHQPVAPNSGVKQIDAECADVLCVQHSTFKVAQPNFINLALCALEHDRRKIGRQHVAAWPNPLRRQDGLVAHSRGDVEHSHARSHAG